MRRPSPRRHGARRAPAPASRRPCGRRSVLEPLEDRRLMALSPLFTVYPERDGTGGDRNSTTSYALSSDGQLAVFQSSATNLSPNDKNDADDIFLLNRGTGQTTLISASSDGFSSGNGASVNPVISPDGRFVAFESAASNLVANDTNLGATDVFVRDLQTNTTRLVSRKAAGTGSGNRLSLGPVFSGDGYHLAFLSDASDLVPGVTVTGRNLFVHNLLTGNTQIVNTNLAGTSASGNVVNSYSISDGGNFVAFSSTASDLVPLDENGLDDIFLRNMAAGTTSMVTIDPSGGFAANGHSWLSGAAVSADGRYVVWHSNASNHVSNDFNGTTDVFLRDMVLRETRLISERFDGTRSASGASLSVHITPNGSRAIFQSTAGDLIGGNVDTNGVTDIYVYNVAARTSMLASVGTDGRLANLDSYHPSISPDGRYVGFTTNATNLADGDVNSLPDGYVHDMLTGTTLLATPATNGSPLGVHGGVPLAVSRNGGVAVYAALADDPGLGDQNTNLDIYVADVHAGSPQLASRRYTEFDVARLGEAGGWLWDATPDGRFVAFTSGAWQCCQPLISDLDPETYVWFGWVNAFVLDRQTGDIRVVSRYDDGTKWRTGQGHSANLRISDDGRYMVFSHGGLGVGPSPFDPGIPDGNNGSSDVFLADLQTNQIVTVSANAQHNNTGNQASGQLVDMSPDGRYIAFLSAATDLTDAEDLNGVEDLFLWDRDTNTTTLITRNAAGDAANGRTSFLRFSGDGGTLAFVSTASDLVPGVSDTNNVEDVFVYSLSSQTIALASLRQDGTAAGNGSSGNVSNWRPVLSDDGRYIAFASRAGDLTVEGVNGSGVFVRDLADQTTVQVSRDSNGNAANGVAPSISADGKTVAFQSNARLVAADTNFSDDVYVHDLESHQSTLISVDAAGSSATGLSFTPHLSPSGNYVAFSSRATTLISGFVDGNSSFQQDLFVRNLQTDVTDLVSQNVSGTASANDSSADYVVFTDDDATLFFGSSASNIWIGDGNRDADWWAYAIEGSGTIGGRLFADRNGNGTADAGEGLANWTVFLDTDHNGLPGDGEPRLLTDPQGHYAFHGLAAGDYRVAVRLRAPYEWSGANTGFFDVHVATATSTVENTDFAVFQPLPDLAVTQVTTAEAAVPGGPLQVDWSVQNLGSRDIVGDWQDGFYLSIDTILDASDSLLGVYSQSQDVPAGGGFSSSRVFNVPPVVAGDYYVLALADRRLQVSGDPRSNNTLASDTTVHVAPEALELDVPVSAHFDAAQAIRYYRLDVSVGGTLLLELANSGDAGVAELAIRRDRLPTRGEFDARSQGLLPDALLVVPVEAGTYFVRATLQNAEADVQLRASLPGLSILRTAPAAVGNSGSATLELLGTELSRDTRFELIDAGGGSVAATAARLTDSGRAFVTFDLNGVATGTYDLRAYEGPSATPDAEFVLGDATEITEAGGGGIVTDLIVPGVARAGRNAQLQVAYDNPSAQDAITPLLTVTSPTSTWFGANPNRLYRTHAYSFLAAANSGPAGVLRAGSQNRMTVAFLPDVGPYEFELHVVYADDATPMDWSFVEERASDARVQAANWAQVFAQFQAQVGDTWGDFVTAMAANASNLPPEVGPAHDLYWLIEMELRRAAATLGPSLSGQLQATDAHVTLSGRFVQAQSVETDETFVTQSQNDGSFIFDSLTPGDYRLAVVGVVTQGDQVSILDGQATTGVIVNVAKGNTVTGIVTRADDGRPIRDAVVRVLGDNNSSDWAFTDEFGRYSVSGVPAGANNLIVEATGFARSAVELVVDGDQARHVSLDVESVIEGTLDGAVPVSGAQPVKIFAQRLDDAFGGFASEITEPTFRLAGLPAGTYRLWFMQTGSPTREVAVTVSEGATAHLDGVTFVNGAHVGGTVTSTVASAPAAYAELLLEQNGRPAALTYADANGGFAFPVVPAGDYTLRATTHIGHSSELSLTLSAGDTVTTADVLIQPGGVITGRVTDAATGDPLSGVAVHDVDANNALTAAVTDADGRYRLPNRAPGTHNLYLTILTSETQRTVDVQQLDETEVVADFAVSFPASLSGTVMQDDGTPVAQSEVNLFENGELVATTYADDNGDYQFRLLRGGNFEVQPLASSASFARSSVSVGAAESAVRNLVAGTATLNLNVSGQRAGDEIFVALVQTTATERTLSRLAQVKSGSAQLTNLAAGQYSLHIGGDGDKGYFQTITVQDGGVRNVSATLATQSNVSGTVRAGGSPVAGADVYLISQADANWLPAGATDRNGNYVIDGLPDGEYDLVAFLQGYQPHKQSGLVVSGGRVVDVDLLDVTATIHGRAVTQGTSFPIPNVVIRLLDDSQSVIGETRTATDGSFSLSGMAANGMSLTMQANGYEFRRILNLDVPSGQTDLGDLGMVPIATGAIPPAEPPTSPPPPPPPIPPEIVDPPPPPEPPPPSGPEPPGPPPTLPPPRQPPIPQPPESPPPEPPTPPPPEPDPECPKDDCKDIWSKVQSKEQELEKLRQEAEQKRLKAAAKLAELVKAMYDDATGMWDKITDFLPATDGLKSLGELGADLAQSAADSINAFNGAISQGGAQNALNALSKAAQTAAKGIQYGLQKAGKKGAERLNKIQKALDIIDQAINQNTPGKESEFKKVFDEFLKARQRHADCKEELNKLKQEYYDCLKESQNQSNDDCDCKPNDNCNNDDPPGGPGGDGGGNAAGSFDPNDIAGPAGSGELHYVRPGRLMAYTIRFENDPAKATAPAQEVFISYTLDSGLDVSTFQVTSFGFGPVQVDVPPGLQQYETVTAYANPDGSPLNVRFSTELDVASRTVTFALQSFDPDTGQLPAGVFDGFLPPNYADGLGEGYVTFLARSTAALVTDDQIQAQASIVFDVNAPIVTNNYTNRVDRDAPQSTVDSLPAITSTASIPVQWSGTDNGSGISSYDVYVSDNGGPFALWLRATALNSAVFDGQDQHAYRFYSIATDGVGLIEAAPASFDAETLVQLAPWQNPRDRFDIDDDGVVAPVDVLYIFNYINTHPGNPNPPTQFSPPPYLDTNGDGLITPVDALGVINKINGSVSGEGESRTIPDSDVASPTGIPWWPFDNGPDDADSFESLLEVLAHDTRRRSLAMRARTVSAAN